MSESPELQQVMAELAAEKGKRALRGRLVFGFLLGVTLCAAGFASALLFVVTPKTQAMEAEFRKALDTQKHNADFEVLKQITEDNKSCEARLSIAKMVDGNAPAPGFTTLLEPTPAKSSAALQLFDVIRPGLGTMLAKLQSAQSTQVAIKWVVDGHVKPAAVEPQGSSYCWLNASGEVETCQAVSQ